MDYVTTTGLCEGDNAARWKGDLAHRLPARSKVAPVQHFKAMPYTEMPQFMVHLRDNDFVSSLLLELCILTAMRVSAIIGARWIEFSGDV